ncbi:hypothetical protein [Bacillus manliponensis]|uniref:hypothetical protein n=1 Tax=Bacillus manliponensis TaxID=574376 RepID=UPI0035166889
MAEQRNIRIEDDQGNQYFPHGKAKTTFLATGENVEQVIDGIEKDLSTHSTDNKNHVSAQDRERWNGIFGTSKEQKDDNGTYQIVEKKRPNGKLFKKAVFSNPDANGNWLVRTNTEYAADGITVVSTFVSDIIYDNDGDFKNEVIRL